MRTDFEAALRAAKGVIAEIQNAGDVELVLMESLTRSVDKGWIFFYNSEEFVRTGRPSSALAGNGPIFVSASGKIHEVPSQCTVEQFLESYKEV